MPTGYTTAIKDGISFSDFVMRCARAFGPLITMRDDPHDAAIPERFEPSAYHKKALEEVRARLAEVEAMSCEEAEAECVREHEEAKKSDDEYLAKARNLKEKYEAMLAEVRNWTPPTPAHVELKSFMEQQILRSIDFDCETTFKYHKAPERKPWQEWHEELVERLAEEIEHHAKEWAGEQERAESRTQWVQALRRNLAKESAAVVR